jgi:cell division protein ZapB
MTEIQLPLEIQDFANKLDLLIDQFDDVKNENSALKVKQEALIQEKNQLLEKTTVVKARVEAMIARLKVMEQSS